MDGLTQRQVKSNMLYQLQKVCGITKLVLINSKFVIKILSYKGLGKTILNNISIMIKTE